MLLTAPGGLVQQLPKDMANLGRLLLRGVRKLTPREGSGMIEVEGLTVRFAGVTPIDDMSVVFPGGTCGLIGPNGAGKTTFFNVLSGFVKPAAGSISPSARTCCDWPTTGGRAGGSGARSRRRWRSSSCRSSTTSR